MLQERVHTPRRDHHRTNLGIQVAKKIFRVPHIDRQHVQQVLPWHALIVEF